MNASAVQAMRVSTSVRTRQLGRPLVVVSAMSCPALPGRGTRVHGKPQRTPRAVVHIGFDAAPGAALALWQQVQASTAGVGDDAIQSSVATARGPVTF